MSMHSTVVTEFEKFLGDLWDRLTDPVIPGEWRIFGAAGSESEVVRFAGSVHRGVVADLPASLPPRWNDDVALGRPEVSHVRNELGFDSYTALLETRARERDWQLRWFDSADDLWAGSLASVTRSRGSGTEGTPGTTCG